MNCPSSIPLRRRHALAAALFLVSPAISSAQDVAAGSYRELETKYIFGFTEGSDIGPEGERAIEFDSNLAFQKRQGVYNALEQEIEYETNPTQRTLRSKRARMVFIIRSAVSMDSMISKGANFGGLSSNFRYNLIGRGPGAPVGLTFSVQPEWSRVNDAGKVNTRFGATAKILADTELVPDRLFAAVNAIYAPEVSRDFGNPDWMKASTLGLTTALTCRIAPEVTLGGELEYYRANDSFWLANFAGHALYAGPTLFVQMTNKILLAATFSTQIAGHAAGGQDPLDLTNFSRNKARLLVEIEF